MRRRRLELVAASESCAPRSTRWCRAPGADNPIDLAGGETRDTVPEVLDLICAHERVDAVIHLGIGIQAAQAQAFRTGPFHPGFGLDRIVAYHERQDRRYAEAARQASERHGKPVLTASELAATDRAYGKRASGRQGEGRLATRGKPSGVGLKRVRLSGVPAGGQ